MSKGNSCIAYPEVTTPLGVVTSRMYKDFMSKDGLKYPRPFVNLIYAIYPEIEPKMEAEKNANGTPRYQKNMQGQFNAKDVAEYLHLDEHMAEVNDFQGEEYRLGATDGLGGKRVNYTNAEEALEKVRHFNETHKMLVAAVNPITFEGKTVYQIHVYHMNSDTVDLGIGTRERLQAWDIYKQVFNAVGIDLTSMPEELAGTFNAYNIYLCDELRNLTKLPISNMYRRDALKLLYLDKDSKEAQRLVAKFGSLEEAAQALDDFNKRNIRLDSSEQHLLQMAINHARKLGGVDITALTDQVNQLKMDVEINSPEVEWKERIRENDKKWHLSKNEIARVSDKINTLSDATAESMVAIQRKIDELNKQYGNNDRGRELEKLLSKMQRELNVKHYYSGMLDFLGVAKDEISHIDELLKGVTLDGTAMENVFAITRALQRVKEITSQYKYIIDALASDSITMEEVNNQIDIDNIKAIAKELQAMFNGSNNRIEALSKKAVYDFFKVATDGKMSEVDINNMLEKSLKDAGFLDGWLYSMGNANNMLIAASGTIVRNAQLSRNQAMNIYSKRIDKATNKLYKSGIKDTKFMYDDQRHIASDIDWQAYESAKSIHRKSLRASGLDGFELKQAMEDWVDEHTEDRLVDKRNQRYEKVPNQNYRKAEDFQAGWTDAQKEYYDTVMEMKAELETLYPDQNQNYYLPPQVRRETLDAFEDAKGIKDIGKALMNKVKDQFVVREDDDSYGIIAGEETQAVKGDYDNTRKREIPIFYQTPVEEGELLLDFSGALAKYAKSATNYAAMDEIKDTVEFMRDYAWSKSGSGPRNEAEIVQDQMGFVAKALYKKGKKSNVGDIMDAFIEQHIYGVRKKSDVGLDKHRKVVKFFDAITRYTSFKGLVTNLPGATANALMGVEQIFIDAGCGEFFDFKDVAWASTKLFGSTGIAGDAMEYLTYNRSHAAGLFREKFDPMQEVYGEQGNKRYQSKVFRQLLGHDFSYMGYGSGEYLIHMLPMYAILHRQKVMLDGKKISLYDAYEVSKKEDGNAYLKLKDGVTDLNGNPITEDYEAKIRKQIMYANQTMHGAMNEEDKGLIHRYILGRMTMNFRQWAVGHYSRRFRGRHWDFAAGGWREGYWVSTWKMLTNEDSRETWKMGHKKDAMWMFMKDFARFISVAQVQWNNLDDMQKYNIKRARTEIYMYIALCGLSFALGEPDDHKREFWRRWWIYQTKRMLAETGASLPGLTMLTNFTTMVNSPIAGLNTLDSLLYSIYGLYEGDVFKEIQSGAHKGENRYWRNVKKYLFPFIKDYERIMTFSEDDSLFKVFDITPSNH